MAHERRAAFLRAVKRVRNVVSYAPDLILSKQWSPYSRLAIKGDGAPWVLNTIASELRAVCHALDINTVHERFADVMREQCVFHTSKYSLLPWKHSANRLAFAYFHGDPAIDPDCRPLLRSIEKNHSAISRIWVSNSRIQEVILETGIREDKVFRIPISVDIERFPKVDLGSRENARKALNIPPEAFVIGSFQKDGVGMGSGSRPKLIKGPDVFLRTLESVRRDIPNLFVLLTGPARGYVRAGLEELSIPYRHVLVRQYREIASCFHALDLYLVTSREEGGPRAILEAMASGIPLVSTQVGQATDLISHEQNGWIAGVEDVAQLEHWVRVVSEQDPALSLVVEAGRSTAEANSYDAQQDHWARFFKGFVNP